MRDNTKNLGKSISSRIYDKFRILDASLDQLVCLTKNTSNVTAMSCEC